MAHYEPTTDELAAATESVLTDHEWIIDGVPAEVEEVGTTVDDEVDIRTTAGMFTREEWYKKMGDGEIQKV
jgi:hypothetical protein